MLISPRTAVGATDTSRVATLRAEERIATNGPTEIPYSTTSSAPRMLGWIEQV
jgi:hypothetical protein